MIAGITRVLSKDKVAPILLAFSSSSFPAASGDGWGMYTTARPLTRGIRG